MTGTHGDREGARLVPEGPQAEIRLAAFAVRPQRLAFLVSSEASSQELLSYVRYNTSVWGGIFNFFIPLQCAEISEPWWRALRRFDPDKVVLCTHASSELTDNLRDAIQPLALVPWSQAMAGLSLRRTDSVRSVPMWPILWHAYKASRLNGRSNARLPRCGGDDNWRLCVGAMFGDPGDDLRACYRDVLKAEDVDLGGGVLGEYLKAIEAFDTRLYPLNATGRHLSADVYSTIDIGADIVVLGEELCAEDFCVFWDLRAAPSLFAKEVLVVPQRLLSSDEDVGAFGAWYSARIPRVNALNLLSRSLGPGRLLELRDRLQSHLPVEFIIDIRYDGFSFEHFRVREPEARGEVRANGRLFTMRVPRPTWTEEPPGGARWMLDVDLYDRSQPDSGYIPPRFEGLNGLLVDPSGQTLFLGGYPLRPSQRVLSFSVSSSTDYLSLTLPDDQLVFRRFLARKGYHAREWDKSRYTRGMLSLLGDGRWAAPVQDARLRALLRAMVRPGAALTLEEMKAYLRPGGRPAEHRAVEQVVEDLALRGVLLRGYHLRCPLCDLERWYATQQITERVRCAGCLSSLQPPVDARFHYRMNELFVRGVDQGCIPVLLTIRLLSMLGLRSFLFVPGLELSRHDATPIDVDFLASCDGHLVLAECKDGEGGWHQEVVPQVVSQFTALAEVAQDLGAEVVILSTLLEEAPAELDDALADLRGRYPRIGLHLALRRDLETGRLSGDGKEITYVDELLAPPPVDASGYISAGGNRRIVYG